MLVLFAGMNSIFRACTSYVRRNNIFLNTTMSVVLAGYRIGWISRVTIWQIIRWWDYYSSSNSSNTKIMSEKHNNTASHNSFILFVLTFLLVRIAMKNIFGWTLAIFYSLSLSISLLFLLSVFFIFIHSLVCNAIPSVRDAFSSSPLLAQKNHLFVCWEDIFIMRALFSSQPFWRLLGRYNDHTITCWTRFHKAKTHRTTSHHIRILYISKYVQYIIILSPQYNCQL